MSPEPSVDKESAIVEDPATTDIVVKKTDDSTGETEDVKEATEALVEAIKKLATSEMQAAGDFSREAYLKAVTGARETLEKIKLIDAEQIEKSVQEIQTEADKNWQSVLGEIMEFGDRLTKAAQVAWDILTAPSTKDDKPPKQ